MRRLRLIPIVLALLSTSCGADYPSAPDATVVSLRLLYGEGMSYAAVGKTYSFQAYVGRSDGAYEDVSSAATWLSSDPQVFCPQPTGGKFVARAEGRASIAVRYQSMLAELSIPVVQADRLPYPRLTASGGDLLSSCLPVGRTMSVFATLDHGGYRSESATDLVTWTSADSSVLKVEGSSVTGIRVGTTSIRTSYGGVSVEYNLSVHPTR